MKPKYKEYLKLNKNILIGFAASIVISAIAADYFSSQEDYVNTSLTLIVDYTVFFSTFGALFYLGNRKKYVLENGQTDKSLLKSDLVKIVLSFGSSEIIYSIVRWGVQYELLILNYDAYMASVISHILAAIVFFIVINLGVNFTKLFKNKNQ